MFTTIEEDGGGIIGFPIYRYKSPKKIIFVLTIKSDNVTIDNKFKKKFSGVVDMFAKRFQLEHELSVIKNEYHFNKGEGAV